MTFKENDFPDMIDYIKNLLDKCSNPFYLVAYLTEMIKVYKKISLYPGIVNMCLAKRIKENVDKKEITEGNKVIVKLKDGTSVFGIVEKNNGKIVLKNVLKLENCDRIELNEEDIEKKDLIISDTLRKTWPVLVFEEEKNNGI